ncbi:hypothetical protein CS063_02015 [Sporanaerobium hydrogeniformans]|uniref:Uncharacterized protein n=1 Tax=Sporanaerobium hydrogeniformans TaxID=3072179 RepID=A0AC61DG75_9FIRM|nr:tetratricopeptide repeat protein [Sporanaerobium hydrogeniformans]PHV72274.1 hypothetical protein CS063_02015 [Sporanaerobium hydrogeniformans]
MEGRCPYCGELIYERPYCLNCKRDVRWVQKIYTISKAYFYKGYQEAENHHLTSAEIYLKKAVYYNKYNSAARNLLGLIYYESGKISLALKEWIISEAILKEDNFATHYIKQIQEQPKLLVTAKDSIHLYNKALLYLQQGNEDVAIIRLKKAVSLNPNLVEARNLLALCYIKGKQFFKANEQIKEVLRIDPTNPKALTYYKEVSKEDIEKIMPYEIEYVPRQSKKQVQPAKIINRGPTLAKYVANFIVGALCMFCVQTALILPNEIQNYKSDLFKAKEAEEKLEKLLQEEKLMNEEMIAQLKADNEKIMKEKASAELNASKIAQKTKLTEANQYYLEKDWIKAADTLYNIAASLLEEEDALIYANLKQEVYERAASKLYEEGYSQYRIKDFVNSRVSLEKALVYEPTEAVLRKTLYYLGCIEKENANIEKAKYYFEKVVKEYPQTNESSWSSNQLNALNS